MTTAMCLLISCTDPATFPLTDDLDYDLTSSLIGRLLWYINPESTTLLPKELIDEYNLTINHLNTAFTNVSAKLSRVNIHRRWFKAGLFGNKHLKLVSMAASFSLGVLFKVHV